MKKLLLITAILFASWTGAAQEPVIEGDVMLCPDSNGTAGTVTNNAYDSYQWYVDFYPHDEFTAIEGATEATFTYDWFNYDQAKLKLAVTIGGNSFESNILQIDSYQWGSMFLVSEVTEQVRFDDQAMVWVICEGSQFVNTLQSPYTTNIQWYKDGVAIDGATDASYSITSAGSYTVVAGPAVCPDNTDESEPIIVTLETCNMGTVTPDAADFAIYPNPAANQLNLSLLNENYNQYRIYDIAGKVLLSGSLNSNNSQINVSALENGTYLLQLTGGEAKASKLFIKQ